MDVVGNTTLIGGATLSTQEAIDRGNNYFNTGGELSLVDLKNKAEFVMVSDDAMKVVLPDGTSSISSYSKAMTPPKALPAPVVTSEGTANAATGAGLKLDLQTTQAANEVIDSLKATGQLPSNYVTKGQAYQKGWQEGKAVNNFVPGGQIGGDVFRNADGLLPAAQGRIWYEADIGLSNTMARGNAAQPASRLLYSSDGLLYVTPDHYKTMIPIGRWKN